MPLGQLTFQNCRSEPVAATFFAEIPLTVLLVGVAVRASRRSQPSRAVRNAANRR